MCYTVNYVNTTYTKKKTYKEQEDHFDQQRYLKCIARIIFLFLRLIPKPLPEKAQLVVIFFNFFFFLTHKARINTTGQCSQTLLLFLGRTGKKLALVSRWLRKILIMKDLQHLLTALGSNAETNPKLNFGQENLAVHLGHDCQLESLAYSKAVLRLSSQSAINGTQER